MNILRESGVVEFFVELPGASLAHAAATMLLGEVNAFNVQTRQSQARAEREFVSARLAAAQQELREAESALQRFLESNRNDPRTSPRLSLDYDRLQRVIGTAAQVVASLTQSLEQARIDEVRDTPVITIIEPPSLPTEPSSASLGVRVVGAVLLALAAAFAVALAEYIAGVVSRSDPHGMARLRSALLRPARDGSADTTDNR